MLLSLDIALSNTGWVLWERGEMIDCGVVRTEKNKKKTVRTADDNADRAALLSAFICTLLRSWSITGVLGELPSGSQNARAANQLGIALGAVVGAATAYQMPCEWCSQQEVKKAVSGRKNASKDEIIAHVAERMGWVVVENMAGKPFKWHAVGGSFNKTHIEHIADAVGVYWALSNGVLVRRDK